MSSVSSDNTAIGQVFTPLRWAEWAIEKGPYKEWLAGGVILDPTGGSGIFLEAFIATAQSEGRGIARDMLERLFMVEVDPRLCKEAICRIKAKYDIDFPESNIVNDDFFNVRSRFSATSIVGNPPWINFTELPDDYKQFIKPSFVRYGLVPDLRKTLWGGSRVDLAAAVLAKCVQDHCSDSATILLYLPLSLFMNDGAHQAFRELSFKSSAFGIEELHDLTQLDVFPGIGTRYCLAKMKCGQTTRFPVDYWIHQPNCNPIRSSANTLSRRNNSLTLADPVECPAIPIPRDSLPRQGVNTCGANSRFFFDTAEQENDGIVSVSNTETNALIEEALIYPLIDRRTWKDVTGHKHVFLPYDCGTGKPLEQVVLEQDYPLAWRYLRSIADQLQSRKGKMLGQQIAKGLWWSLLGVGGYTFAPHKIVWQAYGKSEFAPRLFSGNWIPNQSLQAFMPFSDKARATDVLQKLIAANLTEHLRCGQMAGTASWAQPGKIKAFLEPVDEDRQLNLFDESRSQCG